MRNWIGDVLTLVGTDCHERGEPLLSALCVQKDGTIGDGYGVALVKIYGGDRRRPRPASGRGTSALLSALRCCDAGRRRPRPIPARGHGAAAQGSQAGEEDAPKATCPKCNIVLPAMANGHCYYCDE